MCKPFLVLAICLSCYRATDKRLKYIELVNHFDTFLEDYIREFNPGEFDQWWVVKEMMIASFCSDARSLAVCDRLRMVFLAIDQVAPLYPGLISVEDIPGIITFVLDAKKSRGFWALNALHALHHPELFSQLRPLDEAAARKFEYTHFRLRTLLDMNGHKSALNT